MDVLAGGLILLYDDGTIAPFVKTRTSSTTTMPGGVALKERRGRDVVAPGGDHGKVVFVAVEAGGKLNTLSEGKVENFTFNGVVAGRMLVVFMPAALSVRDRWE
jgi:hypothetical protein